MGRLKIPVRVLSKTTPDFDYHARLHHMRTRAPHYYDSSPAFTWEGRLRVTYPLNRKLEGLHQLWPPSSFRLDTRDPIRGSHPPPLAEAPYNRTTLFEIAS